MISVNDLSFSYGDKKVFKNFSIEFPDRISVLRGPSGCGKTTLLRIIAGLEKNYAGSVSGDIGRIAFMFQEDRLLPWLTARQNVAIVIPSGSKYDAEHWLHLVDLDGNMDSLPENLSGGQQRRISLARALAFDADTLIIDEPFKGFDPALTKKMAELIIASGKTVIATIHAEEEAKLLGGTIYELKTLENS